MKLPETLSLINPVVRAQKPYHLERRDVPVKLNQNENPFDWPTTIKEEVAQFCRERPWNRYPPFIPEELRQMIADYIGRPAQSIIVGNGSNEMLLVLTLALAKMNEPVIICQPTFTVYRFLVEGTGAICRNVMLTNELEFDTDAIAAASDEAPQAPLIICSPNNPTGTSLDEQSLRDILSRHRGFVILDQAYIEFGGYNAIDLISEYPNLIITRTFSKAFAGAGLRLGYCTGDTDVISEINKIKLPYNIGFFSEFVARTALQHREALSEGIDIIRKERDALDGFLRTLPVTVYRSDANFILVRCKRCRALFDALLDDGILVRDVSAYPLLENCLRISIGTPDENRLLRESMGRFFHRTAETSM